MREIMRLTELSRKIQMALNQLNLALKLKKDNPWHTPQLNRPARIVEPED